MQEELRLSDSVFRPKSGASRLFSKDGFDLIGAPNPIPFFGMRVFHKRTLENRAYQSY